MKDGDKRYFKWGLTVFLTLTATLIAVAVLTDLSGTAAALRTVVSVLSPILYGLGFAYLLNPIVRVVEQVVTPRLLRRGVTQRRAKMAGRVTGILLALLAVVLVIYTLISLVLPQLGESITSIASNLSGYYGQVESWVLERLDNHPALRGYADTVLDRFYVWLEGWLENDLPQAIQTVMAAVTSSVVLVLRRLLYLIIGLIISVYVLFSRDRFLAQSKKLIIAAFSPSRADRILTLARRCHRIFGSYVTGKILDAMIVGVLCFVGMSFLRLPFPMLIATVIGMANVIPFFGPYLGAIPSAVLILLISPVQCLYFVFFILVLQIIDGHVIGPRILGDTAGLSGFWVIVSITVMGGLFGLPGLLLGVPVFAFLYSLVADWVDARLRAAGRPTQTRRYYAVKCVSDLEREDSGTDPAAEEPPAQPDSQVQPAESTDSEPQLETRLPSAPDGQTDDNKTD